jgi:hypothetical protein
MIRGLYRVHGAGGQPDDVRIDDSGIESPLEESIYRARGYQPPVENLPWREDFFAPKPAEQDPATRQSSEKAARDLARQDFMERFRKP